MGGVELASVVRQLRAELNEALVLQQHFVIKAWRGMPVS